MSQQSQSGLLPSNDILSDNLLFLRSNYGDTLADAISQLSHESLITRVGPFLIQNNRTLHTSRLADTEKEWFSAARDHAPTVKYLRIRSDDDNLSRESRIIASEIVDSHNLLFLSYCIDFPGTSSSVNEPSFVNSSRELLLIGSYSLLAFSQSVLCNSDTSSIPSTVTVVESSLAVLRYVLSSIPFSALLDKLRDSNCTFHLVLGTSSEEICENLYLYLVASIPTSLFRLKIVESAYFSEQLRLVKKWILSDEGLGHRFHLNLGSSQDELNQCLNTFSNLSSSISSRFVSELNNYIPLSSSRALVVGSGPSLDVEIDKVALLSANSNVIAAGSSLGTLLSANIRVDAVVLLERSCDVYDILFDLGPSISKLKSITLIASTTIDPRLSALFKNTLYYFRPLSTPVAIAPELAHHALPIAGPESVNAAYEAVVFMGFKEIVLFGADFAALSRKLPRSSKALGNTPRNFDLPLTGNKGKTVFSEPSLIVARDSLQAAITASKNVSVFRFGHGLPLHSIVQDPVLSIFDIQQSDCKFTPIDLWNKIYEFSAINTLDPSTLNQRYEDVLLSANALLTNLSQLSSDTSVWDGSRHLQFSSYYLEYPVYDTLSTTPDITQQHPLWSSMQAERAAKRLIRETAYYALMIVYDQSIGTLEFSDTNRLCHLSSRFTDVSRCLMAPFLKSQDLVGGLSPDSYKRLVSSTY